MNICKLSLTALAVVSSVNASFAADTGVKVNAFIDTNYQYNFNRPSTSTSPATTPQNLLRQNDRAHRQFDISQARIGVSKAAAPVGFDLQLGVGSQLVTINTVDGSTDNAYRLIRKATLNVEQNKFMLNVGRFDADFGMERIDSVDNFNYSRSLIFSSTQPLFFTGAIAGYDFGGGFTAQVGVANGVNRFADNNVSLTYIGKAAYNTGNTNFGVSYVAGAENASNGKAYRHSVNLNAKHSYSSTLSTGAELNFVRGENELVQAASATGVTPVVLENRKNATRLGAAAYAQMSMFSDQLEALRVEWLSDREGTVGLNNGGTRYFSTTATHRYKHTQNLSFWGEVRWDTANSDRFYDGENAKNRNNQVTALVAGTYNI